MLVLVRRPKFLPVGLAQIPVIKINVFPFIFSRTEKRILQSVGCIRRRVFSDCTV